MIEFSLHMADRIIAVRTNHEEAKRYCAAYLCGGTPDFTVCISPADIAFEREKAQREDAIEGKSERNLTDGQLEIAAVQRKIAERLFDFDTILLHGSVVAVDGQAYLFTAKSGTGKSTHTRLWRELFGDRAVMVNDDKPFLRITDAGVLAYGSPWNGKHGLGTNTCVPLKAICILERGDQNRSQQISAKDALFMLLQQTNRPMDRRLMPKYMDLIDRLAPKVSFYRLACNMEPEAAQAAYEAMRR